MSDRTTEILVEALRQAVTDGGEHRLYRSGKLAGLFASRVGASAEAAARAVRDGLIEVTRSETRGKSTIDWVKLTPRGIAFLSEHESPRKLLEELSETLKLTQAGLPLWLAQLQQELRELGMRWAEEMNRLGQRLDSLSTRLDDALRRFDAGRGPLTNGATVSWALDALTYLDERRARGAKDDCPFPELFQALRPAHEGLAIPEFLEGLRQLHDRRAVRLLPFVGAPTDLPAPEYALLDGSRLLYYAAR
jgi:hypothetical protein